MKEITTRIRINAPAMKVWEVLSKVEDYPDWNPFIRSVQGRLNPGEVLRIKIRPRKGREIHFTPRVIEVDPGKKLAWLGNLFISGLLDGKHEFTICETENGEVDFIHREQFRGILVPILWQSIERDTQKGFEEMNRALKIRAEGGRT